MTPDPSLKVISAYRGMKDYIRQAKSNPASELEKLWWERVLEPYWAEWAAGQFNEARTKQEMKNPITDLDGLAAALERLSNSGIERLIEEEYQKITQYLPSPLTERAVCIYAADPQNDWIREQGVLGSGIGDNILLQINPVEENWAALVPYVLAHEYHHAVWGYNYFAVQGKSHMDLLTGLLIEGQADSFASLLYPSARPSWINAITPQQEIEQWQLMHKHLDGNDDAIYRRFFFGDKDSQTPMNSAYTIGYHMVQAYLKAHPGCTILDLMNLEAQSFLTESGYQP